MRCLYRHLFLEDNPKRQGSLKKLHLPNCGKGYCKTPWSTDSSFCGLLKHVSCFDGFNYFYLKHCRVMVIRRGDVTGIAWVFARLVKWLITNQHFTALLIWLRHITTTCFSKPPTNLGSVVQGALESVWEVQFLSDPCVFGCIF